MNKILQEVHIIKATISHTQGLGRIQGQSWAKVAIKPEAPGTITRNPDEEGKKAVAKLSSEELVMKLDPKEVLEVKQMTNGQVRVYFAGHDLKEMMETQRGWTTMLAPTAQIASKSYQILAPDMPLSFDPSNEGHIYWNADVSFDIINPRIGTQIIITLPASEMYFQSIL